MSRDVRNYEKPEVFNPDRFLGDNSELDPRAYVFGFGRRACPGRVLGEAMVFLVVSKALATLNILKLRDENGKEITPALEYEDGVVT
jgi:cytochrome P450